MDRQHALFNTINWQIGYAYPVQPSTTLFLDTIQELFLTPNYQKTDQI